MKKTSFTLKIDNPCQQNWDKMHKNQNGRFCHSCQKNVVDFTNKTPREIANALFDSTEKSCGRFTEAQLEQVYSVASPIKLESKWHQNIAASFLVLLGAKNAASQDSIVKNQLLHKTLYHQEILSGDSFLDDNQNKNEELIISGKLINKRTGEPISFNKVYLGDRRSGTISDIDGNFQIKFSRAELFDTIQLTFGNDYEFVEEKRLFTTDSFQKTNELKIQISLTPIETIILDGLIVVTPSSKKQERKLKRKRKKSN